MCKVCFTPVKHDVHCALQNLFFLDQAYGQVRSFFLRKTKKKNQLISDPNVALILPLITMGPCVNIDFHSFQSLSPSLYVIKCMGTGQTLVNAIDLTCKKETIAGELTLALKPMGRINASLKQLVPAAPQNCG